MEKIYACKLGNEKIIAVCDQCGGPIGGIDTIDQLTPHRQIWFSHANQLSHKVTVVNLCNLSYGAPIIEEIIPRNISPSRLLPFIYNQDY